MDTLVGTSPPKAESLSISSVSSRQPLRGRYRSPEGALLGDSGRGDSGNINGKAPGASAGGEGHGRQQASGPQCCSLRMAMLSRSGRVRRQVSTVYMCALVFSFFVYENIYQACLFMLKWTCVSVSLCLNRCVYAYLLTHKQSYIKHIYLRLNIRM